MVRPIETSARSVMALPTHPFTPYKLPLRQAPQVCLGGVNSGYADCEIRVKTL